MKQHLILVVEDDADTSNLLKVYFTGHNYEVEVATRGAQALELARHHVPDVVLLDIGLPEMDGYAVCQALRAAPRTAYVPVIFLSERTTAADKRAGLSAGAQDYITKPFDMEELRLRVHNLIMRTEREQLNDPRTNLPTGRLVDEQMKRVSGVAGWSVLECRIDSFRPFLDLNGFAAGDDVLKFAGHLIQTTMTTQGTPDDFVGHPANDTFLVLTKVVDVKALTQTLTAQFNEEVLAHYSFMDREQGYILIRDSDGNMTQAPLMSLQVTVK